MVQAFGGKCCICGYCRYAGALQFHHVDPNDKEFGFGKAITSPRAWSKIVEELRKCIMVCGNCHAEIHAGITEIPTDAPIFDESFAEYKEPPKVNACPVCGQSMPEGRLTCSRTCAAKRRVKVDWDSVNLLELKKTMSNIQIGEMLGVSDAMVGKKLRKLLTAKESSYIQ